MLSTVLINRHDNTDGGVFESLQEEKSMDDYGNILGRMVCTFIQARGPEPEVDETQPWLSDGQ